MTRTPPDMETEMNDSGTTHAITWEEQRAYEKEARDRERCYAACRAINPDNPVVVAEALPELVEALQPMKDLAKHHAADAPEWGDRDAVTAIISIGDLRAAVNALAKMKARP